MRLIRIRFLILAVSLYCVGILEAQEMTAQARALATRAVQLQSSGQYEEAAVTYTKLLQLIPNDVATHVNLGVVLVNLGRFDEAIDQYGLADTLLPGDSRIQLNKALAYEKGGRLSEAEKQFSALHRSYPTDAKYTVLLADCESQLGNDDVVIELLQPIQSTGGVEDRAIAYMLGMALLHKGRTEEGEHVLDPVLRKGNTAEAHFVLGMKAFESGDYPEAVKELGGAAALNPKLPQLQPFYGRALLNTGDSEAAAEAFGKALSDAPNDFWANLQLGQILIVKRQFTQASPLLKRALLLRPQSTEAGIAYAEALTGQEQYAEARPYAESAVAQQPDSVEGHRTLQAIYANLHLATLAEGERQKALLIARKNELESPHLNDLAPEFTLPSNEAGREVSLANFRGKSPVVLIFGSYSCPNFRSAAVALKGMGARYGTAIPFFLVYIHEAHDTSQWGSTRNQRERVELAPATNYIEKREYAKLCSRNLHLPFPALVDGMDGTVENEYHAWPSRAFVIGEDGRVLYSTHLTELDFQPAEMEAVLKKLTRRGGSVSNLNIQ